MFSEKIFNFLIKKNLDISSNKSSLLFKSTLQIGTLIRKQELHFFFSAISLENFLLKEKKQELLVTILQYYTIYYYVLYMIIYFI